VGAIVREKERVMCRDRAGKWKLAEIMEIRELKEAEVGEDD
jgi:hypothetical protein